MPRTLARTGALALSRRDAMRLTGKLFALRRDVVLGRNVLDVPTIFWEEASLHSLYEAGREYFEIGERVEGLNERISGASDLVRTLTFKNRLPQERFPLIHFSARCDPRASEQ
jgi:uncharacterized Rmd1/YagE family protein